MQKFPSATAKARAGDAGLLIRWRAATIYLRVFSSQKSLRTTTSEMLSPGHPHSSNPRYGAVEGCDRRIYLSSMAGASTGLSKQCDITVEPFVSAPIRRATAWDRRLSARIIDQIAAFTSFHRQFCSPAWKQTQVAPPRPCSLRSRSSGAGTEFQFHERRRCA